MLGARPKCPQGMLGIQGEWPLLGARGAHREGPRSPAEENQKGCRDAAPGKGTNPELRAPGAPYGSCVPVSAHCPPTSSFPPCQTRTRHTFSWGPQGREHFEVVCVLGRPQHLLPPHLPRGGHMGGRFKAGALAGDDSGSFVESRSCRVLISTDLQGCTAFAKFPKWASAFHLPQPPRPSSPPGRCPTASPHVEVPHHSSSRASFRPTDHGHFITDLLPQNSLVTDTPRNGAALGHNSVIVTYGLFSGGGTQEQGPDVKQEPQPQEHTGRARAQPSLYSWGSVTGFALTPQSGAVCILKTIHKIFMKRISIFK